MTEYHTKFKHIREEAITAVRVAIKSGLFKYIKTLDEKKNIIQTLHETLCKIYELNILPIVYDETVTSSYFSNVRIVLNKPSLVTYLHEFYHYKATIKEQKNTEHSARGWSISLFYLAAPKLCLTAIAKGLILHEGNNSNDFLDSVDVEDPDA